MNTLVVLGMGYSALHYARTRRNAFSSIIGTSRNEDRCAALRAEGFAMLSLAHGWSDALDKAIARADALLVSVAPDAEGDPCLAQTTRAMARAGNLRRIVYLSTVGVYGDHGGGWVDEATPPRPVSARSRRRLEAEQGWRALAQSHGARVDVLRLAGIYGPGRNALANLRAGTARRIVKPGQVFNRIHVEDIARAIEACFAAPFDGTDHVWNGADDEPSPPQDVVACAAGLLGVQAPPEVAFDDAAMTPMARSFYGENKRVSNRALKQTLGVTLAMPTYREGLRALLAQGEGRDDQAAAIASSGPLK